MQTGQGCFGIPKQQSPARSGITLRGSTSRGNSSHVCIFNNPPIDQRGFDLLYYRDDGSTTTLTSGDRVEVRTDGVYYVNFTASGAASAITICVSINQLLAEINTATTSLTASTILAPVVDATSGNGVGTTYCGFIAAGSVLRALMDTANGVANSNRVMFQVTRVA